jgi:cysteine-rich repeat protein
MPYVPTASGASCTLCGNGAVDAGEQCDDGNQMAGDGCNATCAIEGAAGSACPGVGIRVASGGSAIFAGDTSSGAAMNTFCEPTGPGMSAPDRAYTVTFLSAGTATITLRAMATFTAPVLIVRDDCTVPATDAHCISTGTLAYTATVTANQSLVAIVDGMTGSVGAYQIEFDLR